MKSSGDAVAWWLFPLVYLAHLLDERFYGEGTAAWSTAHAGIDFSNDAWLAVNVASLLVMTIAAWAMDRGRLPAWVALTLAGHLLLHAFMHVAGTLARSSVFPGVGTSVLICLPFASFVIARAWRRFEPRVAIAALALSLATMQPLYHYLLDTLRPVILGGGP